MHLEIISPEAILFSSKVVSISVSGTEGEFQLLNNHAPIVAPLKQGIVKVRVDSQENLSLNPLHNQLAKTKEDDQMITLPIESGIIEMKDNKAVILVD